MTNPDLRWNFGIIDIELFQILDKAQVLSTSEFRTNNEHLVTEKT